MRRKKKLRGYNRGPTYRPLNDHLPASSPSYLDPLGEYKYSGSTLPVSGPSDGTDFSKCKLVTMSALQLSKPCGADSGCGFNGFWGGNVETLQPKFYMMSYLYERAEQSRAGVG